MERVVKELINQNKTVSTMESCTGGGVANAITNIPDASKVIKFSAVTYSNEFKEKMGVDSHIIETYSVYSSETAEAMAYNISKIAGSDYGIGITGKLCKPDENNKNGDDNVVYISIYDRENNAYYDKTIWVQYDNRPDNKQQIIDEVTELLYEMLYENKKVF